MLALTSFIKFIHKQRKGVETSAGELKYFHLQVFAGRALVSIL